MNGSKNKFMELAIALSEKSVAEGGGPFGAVVVRRGEVVATGTNSVTLLNDPTAHAEMQALTAAAATLGGKYLQECTLYVTVEPCIMCAGAIGWAQVSRVVWGADDPKRGYTTVEGLRLHPRTVVVRGVLAAECEALMKEFFKELR